MPRYPPTKHLHIGVLFCGDVQLLDLAAVDLFAMCSKAYLKACDLPGPMIALGFDNLTFYYIGEGVATIPSEMSTRTAENRGEAFLAPPNTTLITSTPSLNLNMQLTHDITSAAVAPGKLDILVVPGPDPSMVPSEKMAAYILSQTTCSTTDVLTVCTGIFALARSPGVLDGRTATGPRALVDMKLRKINANADWRDQRRWEVDLNGIEGKEGKPSELWTSGGITEGTEMVAAYLKDKMGAELANLVCDFAGVGNRPREYEQGKAAMTGGFVWLLLRSVWRGIRGHGGD